VTGYLARLVERAVGLPSTALGPRLGPVFPPATAAPPQELPAEETAMRDPGRADVSALPAAAPPPGRPSPPAAPPGAETMPVPAGRALLGAPVPPEPPRRPALDVPPADMPAGRDPAPAAPPATAPAPAARAARASLNPVPERRVPALVGPRPDPPAPAGDGAAAPALERSPRIEVRIGRVEVRAPHPPEAAPERVAVAGAQPPAAPFADLAAARRYVDRRWS
jgi:hypothetical protein